MSITLRGRSTAVSGVPRGWRGPLPDLSMRRRLPELDGYASIPAELLHGDYPDLGILTWALLRLSFDDRQDAASYPEFADALGLSDLTTSAVQQRFQPALAPLLGTWITRRRSEDNVYLYQAIVPPTTGKRYAMLRRSDLALLQLRPRGKGGHRVTVSHLADFARWQLECGQRGWTADSLSSIAARWNVGDATLRRSRDALVNAKLLEVTPRPGGRYTDLVWLRELYDPHWAIPSEPTSPASQAGTAVHSGEPTLAKVSAAEQRLLEPQSRGSVSRSTEVVSAAGQTSTAPLTRVPLIRNLTGGSLTEDLTDLGGASATPLNSVTRRLADAVPQAAPSEKLDPAAGRSSARRMASALLAGQPYLAAADRRWRSGMLATMSRALDRGLEPGHVARAVQRVLDADEIEAHCEIVRAAVKQAWADQRSGMCADCGADQGCHVVGCPTRAAAAEAADPDDATIRHLILTSLDQASATSGPAPTGRSDGAPASAVPPGPAEEPLERYLQIGSTPKPGAPSEVVARWLAGRIASQIIVVDPGDLVSRHRALDRSVAWWATQLPGDQHEALDLAAAELYTAIATADRQAS